MLQKFAAEEDRRQAAASIVAGSSRAAAAAAAGGSEAPRALMPATVLALLMPAAALLPAVGMSALGASTTATAFVTVASIAAGLVTAHLPTAMWARSSGGPDSAAGAGGSTSAAWDATFRDAAYPWCGWCRVQGVGCACGCAVRARQRLGSGLTCPPCPATSPSSCLQVAAAAGALGRRLARDRPAAAVLRPLCTLVACKLPA